MAIPMWAANGVLPPIDATKPTMAATRSPYVVSLHDFVLRFGNTVERRALLDGLLRYRAALQALGLVTGFQWLDGSFLEDIEHLENRAPNDVDVVTFYRLPAGRTQQDLIASHPKLFLGPEARAAYRVDAYLQDLGVQAERLAHRSAYWYSMWSHRRDQRWKGFVQLDLAATEDAAAAATLLSLDAGGSP